MNQTSFPKLSFKKFSHYARMSEETICFVGTVCFDGKPMIDAENHGKGGNTSLNPAKGVSIEDFKKAVKILEEIHDSDKETYPYDFEKAEFVVDKLVCKILDQKDVAKKLKKKILFTKKSKKGIFFFSTQYSPDVMIKIRSSYKEKDDLDKILNEMSIEDATELYVNNVT